jgi:hypothetical protein
MEHLLVLTSGQTGYFLYFYCEFYFYFLFVFHIFCTQKEFDIHADLEFRRPQMLRSIRKIIPANDFIFAIDSSGVSVAFHQTEKDSIAPYSMLHPLSKNISGVYVFLLDPYKIDILYFSTEKGGGTWCFTAGGANIETLFYNKINDSIITVHTSLFRSGYNMRAIPLE